MTEREILLKKISTYQFSILDLQIFLDTHPYDQQVLSQIKECKEKLEHLNNYRICVDCGKEFKIPLSSTNSGRKSNTIYCPDCEALRYEKAHYGTCVICGKKTLMNLIFLMV